MKTKQLSPAQLAVLVHYSNKPIERFDRAKKYPNAGAYKPKGFWVSVQGEGDWESWCRGEEWNLASLAYPHAVCLTESANILTLDTLDKLDGFHEEYVLDRISGIDWERVYIEHDGLIIAPYQWARRFDYLWYYGWDCASGVIWNLDAIESVVCITAAGREMLKSPHR